MISVCIPVFNVDVRRLAETLVEQAGALSSDGIPIEIIFLDDGSDKSFRDMNRTLADNPGIKYHELDKNIGRAAIRNRLIKYADHENLIFMDCDSIIVSEQYLRNYAEAALKFPGRVICGGTIYSHQPPKRSMRLHWKYGIRKESRPVETRKRDSNRSFASNNFLIPVEILRKIPFEQRLTGYGHEDSLLGYELSKKGKQIIHTDNPVLHEVFESNAEFLEKTRQAIQNLIIINGMLKDDPEFINSIRLLKTAKSLESWKLAGLIRVFSVIYIPVSDAFLRMGFNSLKLLDLYKLGHYLNYKKRAQLSSRGNYPAY